MPKFSAFSGTLALLVGIFLVLDGANRIHQLEPALVPVFILGCGGTLLVVFGTYLIGDRE